MSQRVRTRRRTIGSWLADSLLWFAAAGGALCIVLVILAFTVNITLIMFSTGSMSPTIPAGSVAVVQRVPASDIQVGDIVTVDREGLLPITHRITSIEPGSTGDERVITMRGDANEQDDPHPYVVDSVRTVLWSVPELAKVIVWFGNPFVLGGITLSASVLVGWAFWPRKDTTVPEQDSQQSVRCQRTVSLLLIGVGVTTGLTASALAGSATPAQANQLINISSSIATDEVYSLDTSSPIFWDLTIDATDTPSNGALEVAVHATGDAELGLRAEIYRCQFAWSDTRCLSNESIVLPARALQPNTSPLVLSVHETPAVEHLRLALTANPTAEAHGDERMRVIVRATVAEHEAEVSLGTTDELAITGTPVWREVWPPAGYLLAPVAIMLGLMIGALPTLTKRIRGASQATG